MPKSALLLLCLLTAAYGQRRVDPKNLYHRIICVTPLVGSGSGTTDPVRPKYAPFPLPLPQITPATTRVTMSSRAQEGIIAFSFLPTDDNKSAIVEFVARSRAAFDAIFRDTSIQVFEKRRVPNATIETALRKYRKDFSIESFGVVMP